MRVLTAGRHAFERALVAEASALTPEARAALGAMLTHLRQRAIDAAEESRRRSKWMMHAYWKVVAVYAGHFGRAVAKARSRRP